MTEPQPKPVVSHQVDNDNQNEQHDTDAAASVELNAPDSPDVLNGVYGQPILAQDSGVAAEAGAVGVDAQSPGPESPGSENSEAADLEFSGSVTSRPDAVAPASDAPQPAVAVRAENQDAASAPGNAVQAASQGEAQDKAPQNTAPRLDRVSQHMAERAGAVPHRRTVDLAADEDDEDDATFGPKLAAWLQAYRARQAANGNGPAHQVNVLPAETSQTATDLAGPYAQPHVIQQQVVPQQVAHAPQGAASAAWAGRAQVAFDEMLATSPPPEWVAARREREMRGRSGSNWLLIASIALLMAGTATVAFVAAARNAGVDPSIGTVMAALGTPAAEHPARVASAKQAAAQFSDQSTAQAALEPAPEPAIGPAPAPQAAVQAERRIVPGQPTVEIEKTRVVAPAIAAVVPPAVPAQAAQLPPEPEPVRRSTLLIPTEPRSPETPLMDHPQNAAAASPAAVPASIPASPPVRSRAVEAAIVMASTREPGQPGAAQPQPPVEVRVASLNPVMQMVEPQTEVVRTAPSTGLQGVNGLTERAGLLLEAGDVVAARMLYELAARGGNAAAAIGAGFTYDPVHFERLGVRGIKPDAKLAMAWYQRALGGGEKGALDEIARLESWLAR